MRRNLCAFGCPIVCALLLCCCIVGDCLTCVYCVTAVGSRLSGSRVLGDCVSVRRLSFVCMSVSNRKYAFISWRIVHTHTHTHTHAHPGLLIPQWLNPPCLPWSGCVAPDSTYTWLLQNGYPVDPEVPWLSVWVFIKTCRASWFP